MADSSKTGLNSLFNNVLFCGTTVGSQQTVSGNCCVPGAFIKMSDAARTSKCGFTVFADVGVP